MSSRPAWQADDSLAVSARARHLHWGAFAPGSLSAATPHQACEGAAHHAEFTDPMLARARLAGDEPANAGELQLQRSAVSARRAQGSRVATTPSVPHAAPVDALDGSARIVKGSGTAPQISPESPADGMSVAARIGVGRPTQPRPVVPATTPFAHENATSSMPLPANAPAPPRATAQARTGGLQRAMEGDTDAPSAKPPLDSMPSPRVGPSPKPGMAATSSKAVSPTPALQMVRAAADARTSGSTDGVVLGNSVIARTIGQRSGTVVPIGADGRRLLPSVLARAAAVAIGRGGEASSRAADSGVMKGPSGVTRSHPPQLPVAVQRKALGAMAAVAATPTPPKPTLTTTLPSPPTAAGTAPSATPQTAFAATEAAHQPNLGAPVAREHALAADARPTPAGDTAPAASTSGQVAATPSPAIHPLRARTAGFGPTTAASAAAVQRSVGMPPARLTTTVASGAAAEAAATSQHAPSTPPVRPELSGNSVRRPSRPSPIGPLPLQRRDTADAAAQREEAIGPTVEPVSDEPASPPDRPGPKPADTHRAQVLAERVADAEAPVSVELAAAARGDSPKLGATGELSPRPHAGLALRSPVLGQARQGSAVRRRVEPVSSAFGALAARQVETRLPRPGERGFARGGRKEPAAEASSASVVTASAPRGAAPSAITPIAAAPAVPPRFATLELAAGPTAAPLHAREAQDVEPDVEPARLSASRVASLDASPLVSPVTAPNASHISALPHGPVQRMPSATPVRAQAPARGAYPTAPLAAVARPGLPGLGPSSMIQRAAAVEKPAPLRATQPRTRPAAQPGTHTDLAATQMASSQPLSRQALAPSRRGQLSSADPWLQNDVGTPWTTLRTSPLRPTWQPSPVASALASRSASTTMPMLQRRAVSATVDRLDEPVASFGERVAEPGLDAAAAMLRPATISASAAAAPAGAPDLEALVERTCARLFETLAIEQERRGVSAWL